MGVVSPHVWYAGHLHNRSGLHWANRQCLVVQETDGNGAVEGSLPPACMLAICTMAIWLDWQNATVWFCRRLSESALWDLAAKTERECAAGVTRVPAVCRAGTACCGM